MKRKLFLLVTAILFGFSLAACDQANTKPFGTPVPTLAAAKLPASSGGVVQSPAAVRCSVRAIDLLGAWVSAGYPETDPFGFTGADGQTCQGTFGDDVQPLFTESNLWYEGAPSCAACHGPDVEKSYAQLNLRDYAGITAGSRQLATPTDILGGGTWEQSKLYEVLVTMRFMPWGRPADFPEKGPLVSAGMPK